MDPTFKEWVDVIAKIAAGLGVLVAALNYWRQVKIKRAEWLKSLHEIFYEGNTHKDVRRWIDFNLLDKELADDADHKKEEKFADYLNFFEFIANLEKMNQLRLNEIQGLFAYYLKSIQSSAKCKQYINDWEYRNLGSLLNKIE